MLVNLTSQRVSEEAESKTMLMKHRKLGCAFIISCLLAFPCFAQEPSPTPEADPEIDAINAKYDAEYKKLQKQGEQIEKDAPKGAENAANVDVDFSKWHTVAFDVPEFRMKLQKISFDIPEVAMKTRRIVWDNPEPGMKRIKIGEKPEFKCCPPKAKMTPMYMDVPEMRMVRKTISLDIPEFKMNRVDIKVDIPEVTKMRRISFRIPEIKVRKTDDATDKTEESAEEMKKAAEALSAAQTTEINAVSKKRLTMKRADVEKQYDLVSEQFTTAIANVRKAGADPTQVTGEDGSSINLITKLDEASSQFKTALKQIDDALAQVEKPAQANQG